MPTYEYACKDCREHLEVVQSFKDDALTVCPACGGPLRKVFGSIGIAFKGNGFYKTDSRPAAKSESTSSAEKSSAEKSSAEKSSSDKSTSIKPAEKASSSASSESKAAAS